MTDDPRFAGRIRRLVGVSSVALGVITLLAATATDAPAWLVVILAAGWVLMPLILAASLARPRLRYGLVLPAGLVTVALLVLCGRWLPDSTTGKVGWLLITAGVADGGLLGMWFWYRMMPVPRSLDEAFSSVRLGLITVHVGMVVLGMGAVLWSLL
jgi:hypothetical protein